MITVDKALAGSPTYQRIKAEQATLASAATAEALTQVIVEQGIQIAALRAQIAEQDKRLDTILMSIGAGFDGLRSALLAPVELEIGPDGTKRARRIMEVR